MIGARRKITSSHLQRLAVVYLRQSTPAQVRLNVRSTERQYAIAGEAARLGWESGRIVVVDGDLGVSGRDTDARESYKELVARVGLGEVGAIFGLEVSRLARNNADLLRLLEFCALTDTQIRRHQTMQRKLPHRPSLCEEALRLARARRRAARPGRGARVPGSA